MLKQLKSAERLFLLIKKQLPFSVSSVNKGKCMPVAFTYMIQCTPKSFAWQLICSRFTFLRIIHTPEIISYFSVFPAYYHLIVSLLQVLTNVLPSF